MPSPRHARSRSDKIVSQIGGLCAAADLELDSVSSEARAAIRAGSLSAKDVAELRLALAAFKAMGRKNVRLGVCAGKLVPLPLA